MVGFAAALQRGELRRQEQNEAPRQQTRAASNRGGQRLSVGGGGRGADRVLCRTGKVFLLEKR